MWEIVVAVAGAAALLVGLSVVGRWFAAQEWRLERGWLSASGLLRRRRRGAG
jgi:hypothetical protein